MFSKYFFPSKVKLISTKASQFKPSGSSPKTLINILSLAICNLFTASSIAASTVGAIISIFLCILYLHYIT